MSSLHRTSTEPSPGDLAPRINTDQLAHIVEEISEKQGRMAYNYARAVLKLRDEGDYRTRELALQTITNYLSPWLRWHGSAEELALRTPREDWRGPVAA